MGTRTLSTQEKNTVCVVLISLEIIYAVLVGENKDAIDSIQDSIIFDRARLSLV